MNHDRLMRLAWTLLVLYTFEELWGIHPGFVITVEDR